MTLGPDPLGAGPATATAGEDGPWLTWRVLVLAALALTAGFVLGRRLLAPAQPAGVSAAATPAPALPTAGGAPAGGVAGALAAVGEPAPAFALETPDGTPMTLSELRGRPVLLNFFATWCAPCRVEMPHLQRAWERHQAEGLVVLGVDVQEQPEVVPPYLRDLGLTFPVVMDPDGGLASQYRVGILPTSYFIDRDGRIARAKVGFFASEADLAAELAHILPVAASAPAP